MPARRRSTCGRTIGKHPATREASEIIGTFYVHWAPTPALWAIDTDEGFALEDLMQELGHLELQALSYLKYGIVPHDA